MLESEDNEQLSSLSFVDLFRGTKGLGATATGY